MALAKMTSGNTVPAPETEEGPRPDGSDRPPAVFTPRQSGDAPASEPAGQVGSESALPQGEALDQKIREGWVPDLETMTPRDVAMFFRRYRGVLKSVERDRAFWQATNDSLRTAYTKLDRSEATLARAQRLARLGSWERAVESDELTVSKELLTILGATEHTFDANAKGLEGFVHPDDRATYAHCVNQAMRTGHSFDFDHRVVLRSGRIRHVRHQGGSVPDEQGRPRIVFGTLQDISHRKQAEERFRLNSQVFENLREAVVLTDAERRIIDVNPAFRRVTGWTRRQVLGRDLDFMRSAEHPGMSLDLLWSEQTEEGDWHGELWAQRKNGEPYPAWLSLTTVVDERGTPENYIVLFSDISERKKAEKRLEHLAHYDPITGLPNRSLLSDRLHHGLAKARRNRTDMGVIFVDLDGFKLINDTLGHAVGDKVLLEIGRRLSQSVRESDTVGRLGGDEFLILVTDITEIEALLGIAENIRKNVERPMRLFGREVVTTASIGIAVGPRDGTEIESLVRNADRAMYQAKSQGKNAFCLFSGDMAATEVDRVAMAAELRRGISKGRLLLHYQPQFDVVNGRVVGLEALVRWDSESWGMVSPDHFIPLAEETGLITELGEWVLGEACRTAVNLVTDDGRAPTLSVNVSRLQLRRSEFVDTVRNALVDSGLPPERLELEITESLLVTDADRHLETLQALRTLGVSLAVDDFGVGYSSFGYLQGLPIDRLKVDRSFIHGVPGNQNAERIAAAIMALGNSLGLGVVAEGVETDAQLDFVRSNGCRVVQGFLLSEPLPLKDLVELLQAPALL